MITQRLKFIVFWIFLILSFAILATFLVLEAYGYRLNRQTWKLQPTGVIVLNGLPRQIELAVNGQISPDTTLPIKLAKILPGQYDISIKKPDYQTWSKTFILSGGQAIEDDHIQLFLSEPKSVVTTRKLALADLQKDFISQSSDLELRDNEIWYNKLLVTRFGERPAGAILVNNRGHIIFQLGKELRVMDIDGTNNYKLVSLPDTSSVAFAIINDKLFYATGEQIFETIIK